MRFVPVCELKRVFLVRAQAKCYDCIYFVIVDEFLAEQYSLMGYRWLAGNSISRGRLRFERGDRFSLGCSDNCMSKRYLRLVSDDRKLVCRGD